MFLRSAVRQPARTLPAPQNKLEQPNRGSVASSRFKFIANMPSATVVGAVLGLGVQLYTNAVRKLPLMRSPWQHAIAATAGGAFGSWLVTFEAKTEKELAGNRALQWVLACDRQPGALA